VNEDGYLLLSDFGVSRILKKGEEAGSICGTSDYMGKITEK